MTVLSWARNCVLSTVAPLKAWAHGKLHTQGWNPTSFMTEAAGAPPTREDRWASNTSSAHSHLDPPTLPNVTDGHSLIQFLWPSLDPPMRVHTFKKQHISIWHLWSLVYHYFFMNYYIIFLKAHTSFGKDTNLFLSAFKLLNFLSFPMLLGKVC